MTFRSSATTSRTKRAIRPKSRRRRRDDLASCPTCRPSPVALVARAAATRWTRSASSSTTSSSIVGVVVRHRWTSSSTASATHLVVEAIVRGTLSPRRLLSATSPSSVVVAGSVHRRSSRLRGPRRADCGDRSAEPDRARQAPSRRGDRTRTCNLRFWRPLRYQLRHTPTCESSVDAYPARGHARRRGHSPHGATSVRVRPPIPNPPATGVRGGRAPALAPGRAPSRPRRSRSGRAGATLVGRCSLTAAVTVNLGALVVVGHRRPAG